MVSEIKYDKYLEFCGMLPSKDVFYLIKHLFVKFTGDDTIYAVKYPASQNIEKLYNSLQKNKTLVVMSLSEFLSGVPVNETFAIPNEGLYLNKSILVVI